MGVQVDLQLLATFVAVAETSSMTMAAKRLNVTPATVSRSLVRLEDALGVELVHRTTRSVAVTSAGAELLERTGPHVSALARAVRDLPDRLPEPAGTLRITAPYILSFVFLPEVIVRYTALYPRVRVDAAFTNRNVDLVAEGFDVAIRADMGQMADSTVITRRVLVRDPLRLYASPAYLARRGEPRKVGSPDHTWIGFANMGVLVDGWPAEPTIAADDFLLLREATRAGAGVGVLPWIVADPLVRSAELVRVLPEVEVAGGALVLLHPTRGTVPAKVSAFRDMLLAAINPP